MDHALLEPNITDFNEVIAMGVGRILCSAQLIARTDHALTESWEGILDKIVEEELYHLVLSVCWYFFLIYS